MATRWGVATVWHQSGGQPLGREDAGNARLISAAPELYAACLRALHCLAPAHDPEVGGERTVWTPFVAELRAALAKAEGRSR